jgi:hypothetical protein
VEAVLKATVADQATAQTEADMHGILHMKEVQAPFSEGVPVGRHALKKSPTMFGKIAAVAQKAVKAVAYRLLSVLSNDCPNCEECEGILELWLNCAKNQPFIQCSGKCPECRYLVKLSTYATGCICGMSICKVHYITCFIVVIK